MWNNKLQGPGLGKDQVCLAEIRESLMRASQRKAFDVGLEW